MHNVGYNSQRDNKDFGTFSGFRQCFTTCSWMLMSYYSDMIDVNNDSALACYFDDVEDSVGKSGIGEKIKRRYDWIKKNTSYWWLVQQAGIELWLHRYKVDEHVTYCDSCPVHKIRDILDNGPVIIGTRKLGGLPGGHIILLVGYNDNGFYVNDPFGDASTNYVSHTGYQVYYPNDFLIPKLDGGRCLFWVS